MRRKVPRVAGNDAGPRPTLHRRWDLFGASSHPGRTSSTAGRDDGRGPLRALTRLSPEGDVFSLRWQTTGPGRGDGPADLRGVSRGRASHESDGTGADRPGILLSYVWGCPT